MQGIDTLLTIRECTTMLRISNTTFYRRIADGSFPRPIKVGGLSRWSESEIFAAIESAKAKRQSA